MSSPPISDDEIEDFIAEQKARLQHERERTAFQPPPPGAYPSGPIPAVGPRLHPNEVNRFQAQPDPAVFRARDANGNVFDKIVRVDAEEMVPQDAPLATLPLGDHDSMRERMKAEMNREYNEFLRAQEERARARKGMQQSSAARPPPAPARRPPGVPPGIPPPAFSAQSFATMTPSNVQSTGRTPPQPPQYARAFLTEVEPPPPQQPPPPPPPHQQPPPPPPPNEVILGPGLPPNVVRAPYRRDAQLEELAERVRELRTLNAPPDVPPPELVAPYGPPPPPTRTVVQTVLSDASTTVVPGGPPYRVFPPGPSPGDSRTIQTEGYFDPDSDEFFATLPIRDRNSAKQRANEKRNREYNEYLRMKEEMEKHRLLARRAGADAETGLLLPSQSAQDLRALPPPGIPAPGFPPPTVLAPGMMAPGMMAAGVQQPVPAMSVPMSAPNPAQPIIVIQGDSRPYATLRQSRSLSNLAALGDPLVDTRLNELEAELDRTKRRLLGMPDVVSAPRVAYGGPVAGSLIEAGPAAGYAEGPYAVEKMVRPSQHLAGSGAMLIDGPPGIFGGEVGPGDRRRKAEYGRELLAQIEMNREGRRRAKSADLQVDITGYPDIPHATRLPEPARAGPLPLGGPMPGPGRSPIAIGPSSLSPPTHDLYDYFASHHPLDISLGGSPLSAPPMGMPPPGPMVGAMQRIRPDVLNAGMALATDEERKHLKRAREQAYQMELQQQIDQSMRRKERDVAELARYNAQKEAESSFYSPFGRGGGGAPLRDPHGNVITNLRQVIRNPMAGPPPPPPDAVGFGSPLMPPPPHPPPPAFGSPMNVSPRGPPTNAFGEVIQARGGHGIFGTPLTDEQKANADRYKDELRMQIEEKRARAEAERQRQAEEEARENRRLAEQQERIHVEMLEEERQRKMKDVAEQRRKDDLERQLAAANEQNAPRRRRERAPTRNSRQGGHSTFRFSDDPRPPSPPVPALRNRMRPGPPSNRDEPPPRPADPVINQDRRDPERDRIEQDRMEDRMDRDRMDRDRVDREREEELQKIAREREELERERAELERERQRDREDEIIQQDRERDRERDHERTFQPSVNVRFRDLFDDVSSRASTELGVMDDLAKLRSTLQNEKSRIETELEKEARRIQVNDPRLEPRAVVRHLSPPPVPAPVHMPVHAPAPVTVVQPTPVFDMATHRQPVVVHHRKRVAPQPHQRADMIDDQDLDAAIAALTKKGTRPENIDHFRTLRRRERQFKERFPETPQSDLSLEEQQEALIETQKRRIRRLRARNRDDPNGDPAMFDLDPHGPRGAARSERYPDEGRRHMRDLGSADSFNPDRIVQRNERRLRHLKEATSGEDLRSMRNTDDILDKYVYNYDSARGRGTRRDNRTPEDDSWLYN